MSKKIVRLGQAGDISLIQEAETRMTTQLNEGRYLDMIGVQKFDLSDEFRKTVSSSLGVNMDVEMTTVRLFNPSDSKMAKVVVQDVRASQPVVFIVRSRGVSVATDIKTESMFGGRISDLFNSTINEAFEGYDRNGKSETGDIDDETAEQIEANTNLHSFFVLTNSVRIARRIQPDVRTINTGHIYLITGIDGSAPLAVELINATAASLTRFFHDNTGTVTFFYKLVFEDEYSGIPHVNLETKSIANFADEPEPEPGSTTPPDAAPADDVPPATDAATDDPRKPKAAIKPKTAIGRRGQVVAESEHVGVGAIVIVESECATGLTVRTAFGKLVELPNESVQLIGDC